MDMDKKFNWASFGLGAVLVFVVMFMGQSALHRPAMDAKQSVNTLSTSTQSATALQLQSGSLLDQSASIKDISVKTNSGTTPAQAACIKYAVNDPKNTDKDVLVAAIKACVSGSDAKSVQPTIQ